MGAEAYLRDLELPDLLTFFDGTPVREAGEWEKRREEIADLMQREVYGYRPAPPRSVAAEEIGKAELRCSGNALEHHARLHIVLADGTPFSFPFSYTVPIKGQPCPTVLHINFRPDVPDRYMPVEEIVDHGFAIFSFCYSDVASDDSDFSNGLAGAYFGGREREGSDPGKIALWSYAASCLCDYMVTLPEVDTSRLAVVGQSRLGKAALLTGALDPRFAFVCSNCAGCSGDSPMRGKQEGNETVGIITGKFGYWFCPRYPAYAGKESEAPFDQHFLLALVAPRYLLIGSAEQDLWADQRGQYASAYAAGAVWRLYGMDPGLPDGLLPNGASYFETTEGAIGFHYRPGIHFFGRGDWGAYMRFMELHSQK